MTQSVKQADYVRQRRRDRLIQEHNHDPYHSKRKIKGSAVCADCGALYLEGRWTWEKAPADARQSVCPACQRIKDKVPAAFLTLRGDFLNSHKVEIMNLIQNYQAHERAEHPLKRIMGREEQADGIVFTFTDAHLARGIGDALHNAYEGEVDYQYSKEDIMLRVSWTR
ncbi:MAG: BCAM0308 family protein [Gammaproteobacteria bacterium]|nr:BCAM0308 family protein [Gammaproteobacteria bacterium]MDH3417225.1 BCAM0308 family protein [Gammaproteobacteria bacterium]